MNDTPTIRMLESSCDGLGRCIECGVGQERHVNTCSYGLLRSGVSFVPIEAQRYLDAEYGFGKRRDDEGY